MPEQAIPTRTMLIARLHAVRDGHAPAADAVTAALVSLGHLDREGRLTGSGHDALAAAFPTA